MMLSDGVQLYINFVRKNCNRQNESQSGSNNECAALYVDLNGNKSPNTVGRDVFLFVLKEDGLYPAGCDVDNLCTTSNWGYACTCKVLNEGEINY